MVRRLGAFVAAVALVVVAGCTTGMRASDAAASAVRDARSAVASLALATKLHKRGSATSELATVSMQEGLDAVASAQRDLLTAGDVEPGRRAVAAEAIGAAITVLTPLAGRDAATFTDADLASLEGAERTLARAAEDLQA